MKLCLVDDEDGVREPASDHRRELGYKVFEAPDGVTALRMLETITRLDLLITDVSSNTGARQANSVRADLFDAVLSHR